MAVLEDTLLVDGTDVASLPGVVLEFDATSGLLAPGVRRGQNEAIPRVRGQKAASGKVLDAFTFTIPVSVAATVAGDERALRASAIANYRALFTAVSGTDGLVALTRRLSTSGGHVDHTAAGEFVGAQTPTWLSLDVLAVGLQFNNLSGAWFDGSAWIIP